MTTTTTTITTTAFMTKDNPEKHGIIPDLVSLKVPISSVKEDPNNARHHTTESTGQVAASLRLYGQRKPIVVNEETGFVEAGNGTLRAAKKLGWTHIAVVQVADDHNTAAGYAVADNRVAELSEWDATALRALFDSIDNPLDITGVDDDWLKTMTLPEDENHTVKDNDLIPDLPATPVSQSGDLWVLGEHRLLCGDSTKAEDVQRLMKGERANLFATDPPYLVDYDGTNHPSNSKHKANIAKGVGPTDGNKDWSATYGVTWDDSSQGSELYEKFIKAAIDHAIDLHAAWYCWHASKRQAMLEEVWIKAGAFVHQQIVWVKQRGVLTYSTYLWQHEPCLYGWIKGSKPPKNTETEMLSTVWEIDTLAGNDRPDHPTPKPLECFAIPMRQHVIPGGLCYEPFSGSGSQIMAGEMTGRRVFAMEVSPAYVDVAVKRFIQATGKIVFLEGSCGKTFDDVAVERGIDLAA